MSKKNLLTQTADSCLDPSGPRQCSVVRRLLPPPPPPRQPTPCGSGHEASHPTWKPRPQPLRDRQADVSGLRSHPPTMEWEAAVHRTPTALLRESVRYTGGPQQQNIIN